MKQSNFKIEFLTGQVEFVIASGENEAKIIAQSRQILRGNSYLVVSVEVVE